MRGGAAGFLVRTLQESLLAHAAQLSLGASDRAAIRVAIYAERSTPQRMISQTMYTLSTTGFVALHVAMKRGAELVSVALPSARASSESAEEHCSELQVLLREQDAIVRCSPAPTASLAQKQTAPRSPRNERSRRSREPTR